MVAGHQGNPGSGGVTIVLGSKTSDQNVVSSNLATHRPVKCPVRVSQRRQTMSAATAAFLGSGRRMRATVAPPTTVNRVCYWQRNLIELRTLVPATDIVAKVSFCNNIGQEQTNGSAAKMS